MANIARFISQYLEKGNSIARFSLSKFGLFKRNLASWAVIKKKLGLKKLAYTVPFLINRRHTGVLRKVTEFLLPLFLGTTPSFKHD